MSASKVSYFLRVAGIVVIIAGVFLPAQAIVSALLPARGEAYFHKLVLGMWCFKLALVLNGAAIILFPLLYRIFWLSKDNISSRKEFFYSHHIEPYHYEYVLLFASLALALVLRLAGASQSLNCDEIIIQRMFISRGLPAILTYFPYVPHHVLYSMLAWFSERLPVSIEISYRLPAIIFSVGAVALVYVLARRLFGTIERWSTVLLCAISFCAITYSNVAKGYSLTGFLVLAFVFSVSVIVNNWQRTGGWVIFGSSLIALLYTHAYNAYLVIGLVTAFFVIVLRLYWSEKPILSMLLKRFCLVSLIAGLVVFSLYSVQAPQVLDQFFSRHLHPEKKLCVDFFLGWIAHMTFNGEHPVAMGACLLLAAIGLASLVKREANFAVFTIIPVAVVVIIAWITSSFIYPRYVMFTFPFFVIACVEGASFVGRLVGGRAGRRAMVTIFTATFIILTVPALKDHYTIGVQDVRGAVDFVTKQASPDDRIVSFALGLDLFPYYNNKIVAIRTRKDLERLLDETKGSVYLLYTFENIFRNRKEDFVFVQNKFKMIKRFPGMCKDDIEKGMGDIVVMVSLKDQMQGAYK